MDAYSEKDDHIYGTITVPEGDSVIFTTIPYDAGWEVTVDGQKAETVPVLNETLLAFRITPGEHELEFRYKPDCVKYGLLLTFGGLIVFAGVCGFDFFRKHRKSVPVPEEITNEDHEDIDQ